jgi:hypothetical protein
MLEEIDALNKEVRELRARLAAALEDIDNLKASQEGRGSVRVHRIPGVDKIKTIYEPDPTVLARNKQLADELELAELDKQNSQLKVQNLTAQLEEMLRRNQDLALLADNPVKVYTAKEVHVEKIVPQRIGQEADRLLDMQGKNNRAMIKQLLLYVLFYQAQARSQARTAERCNLVLN